MEDILWKLCFFPLPEEKSSLTNKMIFFSFLGLKEIKYHICVSNVQVCRKTTAQRHLKDLTYVRNDKNNTQEMHFKVLLQSFFLSIVKVLWTFNYTYDIFSQNVKYMSFSST